jgi:putative peptidoglycan lipid II flippase
MTVRALMGYGVGLIGLIAVKVLAPGFYAQQDVRTPMKVAVLALVCTQAMNLVLVPWLGHAGLALSIGLAALLNAGTLLWLLRRRGVYRPAPGWGGFSARVALACVAIGAVLGWAGRRIDWVGLQPQWGQRAGLVALVLGGVALLYFAVLRLAGLDLRQFLRRG